MKGSAGVGIYGGRIRPGKAMNILDESRAIASELGIEILLMDADLVFGRIHIESAVEHAFRAFERGTEVAETKMLEVMLYSSGERQLSSAIEKMGLKSITRSVAVIVSDPSKMSNVLSTLDIKRDDSVLDGDVSKLRAFGISKKAVDSVGDNKVQELVLERVARVDLTK